MGFSSGRIYCLQNVVNGEMNLVIHRTFIFLDHVIRIKGNKIANKFSDSISVSEILVRKRACVSPMTQTHFLACICVQRRKKEVKCVWPCFLGWRACLRAVGGALWGLNNECWFASM